MSLSDQARKRLEDVIELQPTKNKELQERWGLDSGSDVHAYLESELSEYYYRDDDSLIRATPAAVELLGKSPRDGSVVTIDELQARVIDVLGGPQDDPMSVVATLHALEDGGYDGTVDEVRRALRELVDRGVVEVVRRTVPTYRLATTRSTLDVEVRDGSQSSESGSNSSPATH